MMRQQRTRRYFSALAAAMLAVLLGAPRGAAASVSDSSLNILDIVVEHASPLPELTSGAWENPALTQLHYNSSLSDVTALFHGQKSERFGSLQAGTYLKTGKLTLQAHAGYDNGALHNLTEYENADPEIVYPYWTYDTIGGNQNLERYEFGGSVNVALGENWNVGASGNYLAGLYYRSRDPRPRNVSGIFDLSVGGSRRVGKYLIGLEANFRKYKQTCDIEFKSELGSATIYHLTGLGTHYKRFAGACDDSYYTGKRWGGSVTLMPTISGVYANAGVHTEKITHILTDLNNLPMAYIRSLNLNAAVGYKASGWAVTIYGRAERRHGNENIFGDATSNQYPQIGSLLMHIVNWQVCGVRGAWQRKISHVMLSARADAGYTHWREEHREPWITAGGNYWYCGASAQSLWRVSRKVLISAKAGYGWRDAQCRHTADAGIGGDWDISKGLLCLGIEASWRHDRENLFIGALSLKF